ncbi:hypothetical protein [Dactylosporangium sp. NPDC005555]|uniref:hypothetical protein n=1 Tax=Dactylosporangium sp. NPDC005555 TaxID=3154889 RepID=UPI0033BF3735
MRLRHFHDFQRHRGSDRDSNLDNNLAQEVLVPVVTGNLVFGSTGDGIHIAAPTTVMRNVTVRNTGYGIEATAGVHDGGGNVAAANGPPAQCVNVRCLPR